MKKLYLALIIAILAAAAVLIIRNNLSTSSTEGEFIDDPAFEGGLSNIALADTFSAGKGVTQDQDDPIPAGISHKYSFDTREILCPLKVEPLLYVILKVELIYSDKNLIKEIRFKKENIEAIIQNVLYTREREELTAPFLRSYIIESVNGILHEGKIDDLVYKDFRIEIRKK